MYTGTIKKSEYGDRFRYDIEPPVDIRGFSGAPIIDEKGYVVGMVNVWFYPKMSGDKFLEAGGEGVVSIYKNVFHRCTKGLTSSHKEMHDELIL